MKARGSAPGVFLGSLLGVLACGPPKAVDLPASDAKIEWVGRTQTLPSGAVRFAWPAVQARLRFEGTALRASIEDTPLPDGDEETDLLAIEVDGTVRDKLPLKRGHREYTLVEGLAPGPHLLVLTKRTEPLIGTVTFHGFYTSGVKVLEPPPRRGRRIEVIGDSISAGFGNEGTKPGCKFDPDEEDATRTYATVAARALEAEVVVQAWTGKGLLRNYEPDDPVPLPAYYGRVLPGVAEAGSIAPGYGAHAIVVAVGTNDFIASVPDRERFLAAYRELLARARRDAPDAHLFLVVSPMLTEVYPTPRAHSTAFSWITALRDELASSGARAVVVDQQFEKDEPMGCGGHPTVKTHARLGAELASAMRADLGW